MKHSRHMRKRKERGSLDDCFTQIGSEVAPLHWRINRLLIEEAIVGLSETGPFFFRFNKYQ